MIQTRSLIVGAAAIALTFGVTGKGNVPVEVEQPLSNSDIVIVDNDASAIGQADNTAEQSAEMGKAKGIHNGERQGETPASQSAEVSGSQPAEGQSSKGMRPGPASRWGG